MQNQQTILTLPNRAPVILDSDLALMFDVETREINRAKNRNPQRFPGEEFAFQLTREEIELASQIGTFQQNNWLARIESWFRHAPWGYTEEGVVMISGILSTPQAIEASVRALRLFRELRHEVVPQLTAEIALLQRELLTANPLFGRLARCQAAGLTNAEAGKVVDKSADAVAKHLRRMTELGLIKRRVDQKTLAHGNKQKRIASIQAGA